MREEDLARLREPYGSLDGEESGRFAAAIGADVPNARRLERAIFADYDSERYGVGWWAPHPDTKRRILISDHLLQCASSIQTNATEARIHFLEALAYFDQQSNIMRNVVRIGDHGPEIEFPAPSCPLDELPACLGSMHTTGVFRAVGSLLDCMAGVIIGVVAVPQDLRRADIKQVRRWLGSLEIPDSEGEALQHGFAACFGQRVSQVGPSGWLDWADAYRNMLVHRGRRTDLARLLPRNTGLIDLENRPSVLTRVVTHLISCPALSDIEGLQRSGAPILEEDAADSLTGLVDSTLTLADEVCGELLRVWEQRRANPELLLQPQAQWRFPGATEPRFSGYRPGAMPYNPQAYMSGERIIRRIQAAALDGDSAGRWESFD